MGNTLAGRVTLVGAGPGDPGLITVKGLSRLRDADVVVYDRLVDRRILAKARKDAELIFVGKGRGHKAMEQADINRCLVDRALEGRTVVRLKGGDPFVFGRGGEEAQALAQAGVPFEVVPGVTSAIAAPAYAGIPLTHRDMASSFTVVSGSEDPSKDQPAVRWDLLAQAGGTLVVLMGWGTLDEITGALIREGMKPDTPVALIRWGTEPYQETVTGTLEDIARRGEDAGLAPPVVAIIGDVVGLRDQIGWFDSRPLFGRRVLVTRSRPQASVLSELLAEEGAEPVEVPTIEFLPMEDYSEIDRSIENLRDYSWVFFTSTNGVEAFMGRVEQLGRDARQFAQVRVGAIGPATALALDGHGIKADLVPTRYLSESILEAVEPLDLKGVRVLLPRADIGRDELSDGLARLGALVDQLPVYRTVAPEDSPKVARELLKDGDIDLVTFTSSSTVSNLMDLLEGDWTLLEGASVACIGPVTAKTAEERGITAGIVAREHTIPGLVSAIKDHYLSLAQNSGRNSDKEVAG